MGCTLLKTMGIIIVSINTIIEVLHIISVPLLNAFFSQLSFDLGGWVSDLQGEKREVGPGAWITGAGTSPPPAWSHTGRSPLADYLVLPGRWSLCSASAWHSRPLREYILALST